METQLEVTKAILIKAIESGYISKHSLVNDPNALEKNLNILTKSFKEIYKAVNNPES